MVPSRSLRARACSPSSWNNGRLGSAVSGSWVAWCSSWFWVYFSSLMSCAIVEMMTASLPSRRCCWSVTASGTSSPRKLRKTNSPDPHALVLQTGHHFGGELVLVHGEQRVLSFTGAPPSTTPYSFPRDVVRVQHSSSRIAQHHKLVARLQHSRQRLDPLLGRALLVTSRDVSTMPRTAGVVARGRGRASRDGTSGRRRHGPG